MQLGANIEIDEGMRSDSRFSVSLSFEGSRMAVGWTGPWDASPYGARGLVRVYEYSSGAGSWTPLGGSMGGEAVGDYFGYSLSLSADGTRVAIGSRTNEGAAGSNSGHVRVYEYASSAWSQLGADIDGEAQQDWSGCSVSLSSDGARVAIGARRNDGAGGNSGHVRVYEYASSAWSQLGADIDGEAQRDQSGHSVSLSADGARVAIGAKLNDGAGSLSGHVRVYEYASSAWSQLGADIDGEAEGDQSGNSVSLSADGTRVAIGAKLNDGAGSLSGHVRVYEYASSAWSQLGADIDGEAEGDQSGNSVSLSADGTRVAIGVGGVDSLVGGNDRRNSGEDNNGHIRVYEYSSGAWSQLGADIIGGIRDFSDYTGVSFSGDGKVVAGASLDDSDITLVQVRAYV